MVAPSWRPSLSVSGRRTRSFVFHAHPCLQARFDHHANISRKAAWPVCMGGPGENKDSIKSILYETIIIMTSLLDPSVAIVLGGLEQADAHDLREHGTSRREMRQELITYYAVRASKY